jgi:hypothetical protein
MQQPSEGRTACLLLFCERDQVRGGYRGLSDGVTSRSNDSTNNYSVESMLPHIDQCVPADPVSSTVDV